MMSNRIEINLLVNGEQVTRSVPDEMLLVDFLRNEMRLTGSHVGCDTTQCGACTILLNGDAVKSCTVFAALIDGATITTIEGATDLPAGEAVVKAFHECHGLQCGYCTPGFVMSVVELVSKNTSLDEKSVRHLIEGNICRCTGYHNIVRAVLQAQSELAEASSNAAV
jgi:aerobic carbon-monoxide dehydrogenase small subunit